MVSSKPDLHQVVAAALAEDLGERNFDVTTSSIVDADLMGEAVVVARKPGVLSGSDAAARVFEMVLPRSEYRALAAEGKRLEPGEKVAMVRGPLSLILIAERTALNFLQRLSGIATVTRR